MASVIKVSLAFAASDRRISARFRADSSSKARTSASDDNGRFGLCSEFRMPLPRRRRVSISRRAAINFRPRSNLLS